MPAFHPYRTSSQPNVVDLPLGDVVRSIFTIRSECGTAGGHDLRCHDMFHRASDNTPAAVTINATAFRENRGAELVTITELSFDWCTLSSSATFETGERLRLHLPGQGWIEAEVQSASDGEACVIYLTECRV